MTIENKLGIHDSLELISVHLLHFKSFINFYLMKFMILPASFAMLIFQNAVFILRRESI